MLNFRVLSHFSVDSLDIGWNQSKGAKELHDSETHNESCALLESRDALGMVEDISRHLESGIESEMDYLRIVHENTPLEALITGLGNLEEAVSREQEQYQSNLKANFNRYVRSSTAIGEVKEFLDEKQPAIKQLDALHNTLKKSSEGLQAAFAPALSELSSMRDLREKITVLERFKTLLQAPDKIQKFLLEENLILAVESYRESRDQWSTMSGHLEKHPRLKNCFSRFTQTEKKIDSSLRKEIFSSGRSAQSFLEFVKVLAEINNAPNAFAFYLEVESSHLCSLLGSPPEPGKSTSVFDFNHISESLRTLDFSWIRLATIPIVDEFDRVVSTFLPSADRIKAVAAKLKGSYENLPHVLLSPLSKIFSFNEVSLFDGIAIIHSFLIQSDRIAEFLNYGLLADLLSDSFGRVLKSVLQSILSDQSRALVDYLNVFGFLSASIDLCSDYFSVGNCSQLLAECVQKSVLKLKEFLAEKQAQFASTEGDVFEMQSLLRSLNSDILQLYRRFLFIGIDEVSILPREVVTDLRETVKCLLLNINGRVPIELIEANIFAFQPEPAASTSIRNFLFRVYFQLHTFYATCADALQEYESAAQDLAQSLLSNILSTYKGLSSSSLSTVQQKTIEDEILFLQKMILSPGDSVPFSAAFPLNQPLFTEKK